MKQLPSSRVRDVNNIAFASYHSPQNPRRVTIFYLQTRPSDTQNLKTYDKPKEEDGASVENLERIAKQGNHNAHCNRKMLL